MDNYFSVLVSIVVPVYKVEEYIDHCIASLVEQDHKALEIILVNDGSPDRSLEICQEWAKKDDRIIIIDQKNQGVSVARNIGLQTAKADWVCFVDGDDYLSKDMVATLLSEIIEKNLDILMCGYSVDLDGKLRDSKFFSESNLFTTNDIGDLIRMCVGVDVTGYGKLTNIGVPWAKMYRKEFLQSNKLQFKPGLKRMQDMIFTIHALNKAPRIGYLDKPLYNYCMRSDSAIHKYTPNYHVTVNSIYEALNEALMESSFITDKQSLLSFKAVCLLIEMLRIEYLHDDLKVNIASGRKIIRSVSQIEPYRTAIKDKSYHYFDAKRKVFKLTLKGHLYGCAYIIIQMNKIIRRKNG